MDIISAAVSLDKSTVIKLIFESHYKGWLVVRNDLIDKIKHELTDFELKQILKIIEN